MQLVKSSLIIYLFLTLCACSANTADTPINNTTLKLTTPKVKEIEVAVLNKINDYRALKGLPSLSSSMLIKSVAKTHSDYMVQTNQVNHDNFFIRSAYLKENAEATDVAENVAYGYTSAESVVRAWLNSDAHLNTIEGDFTHFDISAEQNDAGKWYYTHIFIKKNTDIE